MKALKHGEGGDVRALDTGETAVDAPKVQSYLKRAFGPRLGDAESALQVRVRAAPAQEAPKSQSESYSTAVAHAACSGGVIRRAQWSNRMGDASCGGLSPRQWAGDAAASDTICLLPRLLDLLCRGALTPV